jgi:hypothetical protein
MTDESSLNNAVVVKNNHANSANNNGAIILHQQPTDEVQRIMRKYVSDSTMTCYKNELVTLMFYLFDKDPEKYFHDWIRDSVIRANEKDGECIRNKTRKHLRQVLKESLEDVRKIHCPIIIETLDFSTFSHYVTTRKSKDGKLLSKSAYGGMQSALIYLHKMTGFVASDDFRRDLLQFNRGMKRKVTDQKLHTGSSLEEGKKAMNFDVYKLMCTKLIKMETPEADFVHLFLTLEWNLMARSDNCTNLHISHIEWRNDCLVFFFAKTKGDQTGEKSDSPWHVYSNPFEPCICPVIALAKYIFSNFDVATSKSTLFPGNDQYSR